MRQNMLKNRVVLVTGGGRGIGRTIAMVCAEQGAHLGLMARTEGEVREVAEEIRKRFPEARAEFTTTNVADATETAGAIRLLEQKLGGTAYGLVAAAGVYGPIGPLEQTSPEEWRQALEINVMGVFNSVHAVVSGMKKRGEGRIVLFSGGGQGAMPHFSSYVCSKGAIWRMTETFGAELAPHGIYVNAIAPGAVNTRFLDDLLKAGEEKVGKEFYQKSLKQRDEGGAPPEKAARLALYLLSDRSRGLQGKILSALWDQYEEFGGKDELEALSRSEIYTMKRVVEKK